MVAFSLADVLKLLEKANDQGITVSYSQGELSVHIQKGKQIDRALLEELKENKPHLIHYFRKFATDVKGSTSLPPIQKLDRSRAEKIPLSFSQERLWFIHQLEGSVQYHLPTVLRLRGHLNLNALAYALQNIINRHEILRTVVRDDGGEPFQYITEENKFHLKIIDGAKYCAGSNVLESFIEELIRAPFDLAKHHMLRAELIRIHDEEHVLVFTMHHIASDAWSTSILVKEVVELYASYEENREPRLIPLNIQYADYAVWQRNYLQAEVLENKIKYWKNKLDGAATLQLPTDFVRPPVQNTRGANADFSIDKNLSEQLQKLSQQQGATLFMTLLAAFKILLYRYSNQQDICVGTSMASRDQQEVEALIGFFVNTLTLRSEIDSKASFIQLLEQVRSTTLHAYENADLPFEKVVEAVVKERDPGRNPLFQVMLVLANTPEVTGLRLGDLQLSKEGYDPNISKFDVTFFMTETEGGMHGLVQYRTDLFREETILRMIGHYKELLTSIVNSPHQSIGTLSILSSGEEQDLITGFNGIKTGYPRDKTFVDLFEEQATKTPHEVALVFEEVELTYKELNERSNQLAHYLRTRGVKEDSLVPLCVERSHEMIIGMLGILKSGAAYVPMEPDFPEDRKNFMLEDTASKVVVTSRQFRSNLPYNENLDIIEVDGQWSAIKGQPVFNPNTALKPDHLAYVIYTSGSTGKPKGVMIEHRNLVDYLFGLKEHIQIHECKSFALVSSIATDLGNTVIFSSFAFGGVLHILSKNSVSNIEYLHDYFNKHTIECLKIVPSHWKAISMGGQLLLPSRLIVFGGEALQSELVENIHFTQPGCKVVNHYGPTETTIGKLLHQVTPFRKYNKTIPIGRPFSNTQVYVLSKDGALCPIGIAGELHIAGDGIARGYLNNNELTSQKFITGSFIQENNNRMYRTGDLVRYLPDGNIEFIGRVDDQVKIRGYRVELGEIESIILQSGMVNGVAVIAKEDKDGNKRLGGYIVAHLELDRELLVSFLKEKLPDYMIPAFWVQLEKFPLLPNGKIDRKSLPDPEQVEELLDQYEAPGTETELKLAQLWQDVLEVEQVGINDDFFELGGHSLLAVRLISAIRKQFKVEMPIGDIFDYPTIKLLAGQVHKQSGKIVLPAISQETRGAKIPLSFSQERLWFIDRLEGSVQYHVPAVLELNGALNKDALSYALKNVIQRHEVLRTIILEQEGEPYQDIINADEWQLSVIDGSSYKEHHDELQHFIETLIAKPFILSKDYMLRASLISLEEQKHVLVFILHHIASDGWSRSVLVKEVVELYASYLEQRTAQLLPLTIQYADYAIWQRKYLEGDVLNKKIAYWKEKLQGILPLQLPTDHSRPAVQSTRGARLNFSVDKELSEALQDFSHHQGTTLFMTLLAAMKVLMHRYSGEQDICIGTPIANRMQQEVEELIGFFVNTLALRSNVNGDDSFIELLQQVRSTTMSAYDNQEAPFEKVVEAVVKGRDMSRNPLFQVMFVLRNTPDVPELRFGDLRFDAIGYEHTTSLFDLTFYITETPGGLQGAIEYSTDLYIEDTITRMVSHLKELLGAIIHSPQQKISKLPIISKAEEKQVLIEFNNTHVDYPAEKSIMDLFEEQVLKTPDAIAVVFENEKISYQQLNKKANQVAHLLKSRGVKVETLVPVCIERSVEMIIAVIGILKAGAVYVPIDPEYPEDRINYMLADTDAQIIVSSQKSIGKIQPGKLSVIIEIDRQCDIIDMQPSGNLHTETRPHHLAYILYTSGSTGKPKGVRMPGGGLVNLLNWQEKQFKNHNRRVLQFASLNFDVSFQEIFSTLCFGSSLYLISGDRRKDLSQVLEEIRYNGITHLFVPYIVLKNLAEYILQLSADAFSVEEIIVAGEQLKLTEDIQNLIKRNRINLVNQYGPTEAHVVSSYALENATTSSPLPPIGKPIDNTTLYILGNNGQPVPIGVIGELYIGGVQVARDYLNQPDLTQQKFINDPFSNKTGARLYRTGDLARWLHDGNIEYLGRIDDQVKIRGFRIELGEIESVIQECDLVRQVVVITAADTSGNKKLVSYVVPEGAFDKDAIIGFAKKKLPDFMIPALWIELDSMPITRNGKVDKRALPDPGIVQLVKTEYVGPRSEMESTLVEMWQQLLGVEKIGVYDNFFELGGHSLMVIKMVANIKKRFLLSIPIKALFQFTCINDLANYLEWELDPLHENNDTSDPDNTSEEDKSFEVLNL